MNRSVASTFWTTCFFCAGFATYALAQSSPQASSDKGCVITRCQVASCFGHYIGGSYMKCPDGGLPYPAGPLKGATHALHGQPREGRPGATVSRRMPAQKERS
jgi:hypothetical protein